MNIEYNFENGYTPQDFEPGQILQAQDLDRMEAGIASAHQKISKVYVAEQGKGLESMQQIPRSSKVNEKDANGDYIFNFSGHERAEALGVSGKIKYGAVGNSSTSLGGRSAALSTHAMSVNNQTVARGDESFAAGYCTLAYGNGSFACGSKTVAEGVQSHTEGEQTWAQGKNSHAEGTLTHAKGAHSHSEGYETIAKSSTAHAEGYDTKAGSDNSSQDFIPAHAEGAHTEATHIGAHAEGRNSKAYNNAAHAEGTFTLAQGIATHAEGNETKAIKDYTHAEGSNTQADAIAAHSEGSGSAIMSVKLIQQSGGGESGGTSGGDVPLDPDLYWNKYKEYGAACAHAEGNNTLVMGYSAHAEGIGTKAYGRASHAEGFGTRTGQSITKTAEGKEYEISDLLYGFCAHAEGYQTVALGNYSHAGGYGTIADYAYQTVIGKYNDKSYTGSLFAVGNGTSENNKKTKFEVTSGDGIIILWEGNYYSLDNMLNLIANKFVGGSKEQNIAFFNNAKVTR